MSAWHHDEVLPELLSQRAAMAVTMVPPGRVVSYGDLGALLGTGPRQAGRLMSGLEDVPWWRVTNHAGDLPVHLRGRAAEWWRREGIEWKPNGLGCRIRVFRADLPAWADACEAAWRSSGLA